MRTNFAEVDLLIGGWQLNANINIQSGPPFSILADGKRVDIVGGSGACAGTEKRSKD